tara:strand:- start:316 stop:1053 length:738 start_codon:yes stop_codon:yes gene_type:complete
MVYFLGRDVKVYIGTENDTANKNVAVLSGSVDAATSVQVVAHASGVVTDADYFAYTLLEGVTVSGWPASVSDVTGVDVGIGVMDEDITYIGQRATGKVDVKSEYTISLTRKKANNTWDTIFNGPCLAASAEDASGKHGARWGLAGDYGNSTAAAPKLASGLANPKDYNEDSGTLAAAGYRLFIVFKSGAAGETMAFPNCLITAHTVSINADGTSEETMEFVTQQKALQGLSGDKFNVTQTPIGDY